MRSIKLSKDSIAHVNNVAQGFSPKNSPTITPENVCSFSPEKRGEDTPKNEGESTLHSLPIDEEGVNPVFQGFMSKYGYVEFASYAGERLLDDIVQQILPYALWRTWHFAVDFQAPGNDCYVGTQKIAGRVKPGVRKVEIDLHELEARGLMVRYPDRIAKREEDGRITYYAAMKKDFHALYALAHEYLLWTQSPEYIPPEREYVPIMKSSLELLAKLVRYDNYRHVIETEKPGPKPQPKPAHLYYQCTLPDQDMPAHSHMSESEQEPTRTNSLNANVYLDPSVNNYSAYRESENEKGFIEKDTTSTNFEKRGATTIRKPLPQPSQTETQDTESKSNLSKSNPPIPEEKSAGGADQVKEGKAYNIEELKKDPYALAAALVEMRARQSANAAPMASHTPAKRERRGIPESLARHIQHIHQQLATPNGKPQASLQSDMTRAAKIYAAACEIFVDTPKWFADKVEAAYQKTIEHRRVANRMAYFFTTLENALGLEPEEFLYMRSDEPLYKDGSVKHFINRLHARYQKSQTNLEYAEWVQMLVPKAGRE